MTTVRTDRDRGESLVEIVLTVVIIGISASALFAGLATAANAAGAQRDGVIADTALRNLAEEVKLAARSCVVGAPLAIADEPVPALPDGWSTATSPADAICPAVTDTVRVDVAVTAPDGQEWSLGVVVRTP